MGSVRIGMKRAEGPRGWRLDSDSGPTAKTAPVGTEIVGQILRALYTVGSQQK